jgi:tRNA(Ile)-lysidine synthetase-like protein
MPSIRSNSCEERVRRALIEEKVEPRSHLLVAFSGGPDSSALLHVLAGLRRPYPLKLSAAYLDHGLRSDEERAEELAFVTSACRELEIELVHEAVAPGSLRARAGAAGRSLEEVAREERYAFLRRAADRLGADRIAVGHNADDQVETLIMRFFQGADIPGLRGIPRARGRIIRPLIDCRREEILACLAGIGKSYIVDRSNRSAEYLRNRIRGRLIPAVEAVFPGFRSGLAGFACKMRRTQDFLAGEAATRLPWAKAGEGYRIAADLFLAAPGVLRLASCLALINGLELPAGRIPYRFFSPLFREDAVRSGRVLLSGHGLRLERRGPFLFLGRVVVQKPKKGYLIVVKSERHYTIEQAELHFNISEANEPATEAGCLWPADGGEGPFILRSYRSGDRIRMERGAKRVKELFSEWRVPRERRWKIPVALDRKGVALVLGKPFGYPNRVRWSPPKSDGKRLCIEVGSCCAEEK